MRWVLTTDDSPDTAPARPSAPGAPWNAGRRNRSDQYVVPCHQELSVDLSTSTALVTGANRGFGRALAAELLSRGATVYAGARNPDQVDLPGAKPIALDITD